MRQQSPAEERANAWSAAAGVAGSAGFFLVLFRKGDATAGQWVFAAALLCLHLSSTIYHGLVPGQGKRAARMFDHVAIYVLIAGTYTPFALGPLRTHGGVWLFALEWLLAAAGLAFVLLGGLERKRISNGFYIVMGWLGVFFLPGFLGSMPPAGNAWLLAGGIVYTAGVAFYSARRLLYAHFVWHIIVLGGSACHAVAVYRYSG